jgi:colanic acid biosynthesis glycosyl transferase WcaI
MKAKLQASCANLANVIFMHLQPLDRLGELLCTADIHLLPQSVGVADLVLPSKLSGMLASGRPVIATSLSHTELSSVVSKCGIVVPPRDDAALAEAICRLADDVGLRRRLGDCARAYAEANFDRDSILGGIFGPSEIKAACIVDDAVA